MINPEMMAFVLKAKTEEIIAGTYPEGFILKERNDKQIILSLEDPNKHEGVKLNSLNVSVTYNNIEIIISYES